MSAVACERTPGIGDRGSSHDSRTTTHTGFLFDLYARGSEMVLWLITDAGERLRIAVPFAPVIHLTGPPGALRACVRAIERAGDGEGAGWTRRRDLWTGAEVPVFAVRVRDAERWRLRLSEHARRHPAVAWHSADLLPEQLFAYEHRIFPLGRCTVRLRGEQPPLIAGDDDRWNPRWTMPPLRTAWLTAEGSLLGRRPHLRSLTLTGDGCATTWDEGEGMLEGFQAALDALDPDVILTADGDDLVMPLLAAVAERQGFALRLDRDPPPAGRRPPAVGRSYFTYGRVQYHSPDWPLFGRWHIDRGSSFITGVAGLEGLLETARLSRLPVQRCARRTIGTGITSIQLDLAHREGILIPWKKTRPEAWKTARQLLRTDRGGLVFAPVVGVHEQVVELDFASMYPAIMARFNVSPETVNCPCCRNARVPEIGYTICERRAGLVSRALGPIIAKRAALKRLRAEARAAGDEAAAEIFDRRQSALKWLLVCCFGYLGYRNARFGRIEAHEAVSAFSREILLRTKDLCEARGWRLLHANVDSVWITKPDFAEREVAALGAQIAAVTGLDIALEGIYRWIAFLPSRVVPDRPVPTRFFGVFQDGSLKCRGIEARRGDLPRFVCAAQRAVLERLAAAGDLAACRARVPEILEAIAEMEGRLWRHEVPLAELLLVQRLSRPLGEYRGCGMQAAAARQALRARLVFHPGQALRYVITDQRHPEPERRLRLAPLIDADTSADPAAYVRLLRRAMNTLLWPFGVRLEEERIARPGAPRPRRSPRGQPRQIDLLASRT